MPSADFCLLTLCVATKGASEMAVITLTPALTHRRQISPDKNVNCPCTTAAFTLPPEPVGFVVSCQLARRLSLIMRFLFVGPHVCLGLPSDHSSRIRPCLWLVLLVASDYGHPWFSYRGLSPHKFTPMPGVHEPLHPTLFQRG